MNPKEGIVERVRLYIRAKDGLKVDVFCDERFVQPIYNALQKIKAEILSKTPESYDREIDQSLSEEPLTFSHLSFSLPGTVDRVDLFTYSESEPQVEGLFTSAGWRIFSIQRDVA